MWSRRLWHPEPSAWRQNLMDAKDVLLYQRSMPSLSVYARLMAVVALLVTLAGCAPTMPEPAGVLGYVLEGDSKPAAPGADVHQVAPAPKPAGPVRWQMRF